MKSIRKLFPAAIRSVLFMMLIAQAGMVGNRLLAQQGQCEMGLEWI